MVSPRPTARRPSVPRSNRANGSRIRVAVVVGVVAQVVASDVFVNRAPAAHHHGFWGALVRGTDERRCVLRGALGAV